MLEAKHRRAIDPALVAICFLGLVLRLGVSRLFPNVAHPDETIQYIEQAYRLVTGRGLVPWEYVIGARSWLIPGALVPVVAAARAISTAPAVTLGAIAFVSSLFSLLAVVSAHALGARVVGRTGGRFAALLTACWCELVYFSPHVLADTVCAVPLIAALAIGYRRSDPGDRTLFFAGALLGLATAIRPQLAPAVGLAGIGIAGPRGARGLAAATAGGMLVILMAGMLDWPSWGAPFRSVRTYLAANSGGVASLFGTEKWTYYLAAELAVWGGMAVPILVIAGLGAKRLPLLVAIIAAMLATFSAVGHKEYRFLFPALPLLFTLCGVGTAEALRLLGDGRRLRANRTRTAAVIAGLLWAAGSLACAAGPAMRFRLASGSGALAALATVNADPAACGLALDPKEDWWQTGRVRLRDEIDLYRIRPGPLAGAHSFNRIMATSRAARRADYGPAGFHPAGCFGGNEPVCLFRRETPCRPGADPELQAEPTPALRAVLMRLGIEPHGRSVTR